MSDDRLPRGVTPRLLNRDQAAAYCGVSADQFTRHVEPKVKAVMIGAQARWDLRALDRWLDAQAGLGHAAGSQDKWRMLEALDGDPAQGRQAR